LILAQQQLRDSGPAVFAEDNSVAKFVVDDDIITLIAVAESSMNHAPPFYLFVCSNCQRKTSMASAQSGVQVIYYRKKT